ncbi:hypothetical protein [Sphingopyxis sp.]|nr:hypothetical protein [Sphingopyxis sp.]
MTQLSHPLPPDDQQDRALRRLAIETLEDRR